jgi:hypothetical protein
MVARIDRELGGDWRVNHATTDEILESFHAIFELEAKVSACVAFDSSDLVELFQAQAIAYKMYRIASFPGQQQRIGFDEFFEVLTRSQVAYTDIFHCKVLDALEDYELACSGRK